MNDFWYLEQIFLIKNFFLFSFIFIFPSFLFFSLLDHYSFSLFINLMVIVSYPVNWVDGTGGSDNTWEYNDDFNLISSDDYTNPGASFCAAQAVLSLRMSSSFKRKKLFPITTTCRKLHKSHLNWVKEIIKFLFCGAACIIINFFFIYYCFFINSCHHNKILLYFTGKKIIIISFQVFQRLVCPWLVEPVDKKGI